VQGRKAGSPDPAVSTVFLHYLQYALPNLVHGQGRA
jgi:hypothetical protein